MLNLHKSTQSFNFLIKSSTALTRVLVLAFLVFSFIGIINHEMWRDELQAWLIARSSSSLIELFQNLEYEGHPGLWHSFLYFITRFTSNPRAMQIFHLLLATAVIYVFTKYSPFTRLHKILFTFGYFPFYEYNVISRNYSLGILLIFLFCTFFPQRQYSYLQLSILLAILANTNAYGFIIAICLVLMLLLEKIIDKSLIKIFLNRKTDVFISLFILSLGFIIALLQIFPPSNSSYYVSNPEEVITDNNLPSFNARHFVATFTIIWRSYIPLPNFFDYHFWNTNLLMEGSDLIKVFVLFISLGLLFFSILLFIQKPVALFLYLTGTLSILLFSYEKYFGMLRHHGHLFMLFLACLWISSFYRQSNYYIQPLNRFIKFAKKHQRKYLTSILIIHVIAGIFAFSMDLMYPFSASQEVASFIKSKQLNDTLIVGSKSFEVSPIAALLDRKIYYPEIGDFGSFIVWDETYKYDLDIKKLLERVSQLLERKNTNRILLILNYDLNAERPDLSITKLFDSHPSIALGETYHLYLIQKKMVNG